MWWYFTFNTLLYFHSFKRYFNCLDLCQTYIHHWHRRNCTLFSSTLFWFAYWLSACCKAVGSHRASGGGGIIAHSPLFFISASLKNSVFGEKLGIIQLIIMVRHLMYFGWCHWLHSREISASVTETWITCWFVQYWIERCLCPSPN